MFSLDNKFYLHNILTKLLQTAAPITYH